MAGAGIEVAESARRSFEVAVVIAVEGADVTTDGFDRVLERMRQLFPRPAAVGVRCPATTLGGEIAEARGRCERLPLPYEETRHICRGFASKPLPDVFDS